jgi:hypothetical protein
VISIRPWFPAAHARSAEYLGECLPERDIDIFHGHGKPEIG